MDSAAPVFVYLVWSVYSMATGYMEHFAVFDSWRFVGEGDFAAVHKRSGQRLLYVHVIPIGVLTLLTVAMFWLVPPELPRRWLWIAAAAHVTIWASSLSIQIPLQTSLAKARNLQHIERLIATDYVRLTAYTAMAVAAGAMLLRRIQ